MKVVVVTCLFAVAFLTSCCLGFRKCDVEMLGLPPFRFVDAGSGADLMFGPAAVYDKNALKFYSLNGSDTTFYTVNPYLYSSGTSQDSVFYIGLAPLQPAVVYVALSGTDTDTLSIAYETHTVKCCGNYTTISSFRYNNTPLSINNGGVNTIRK